VTALTPEETAILTRLAGQLIEASIRAAMDEPDANPTLIAFALQVGIAYWVCRSGDDEAREKLIHELELEWPQIKDARLDERGLH
jgi:hypothetical protein